MPAKGVGILPFVLGLHRLARSVPRAKYLFLKGFPIWHGHCYILGVPGTVAQDQPKEFKMECHPSMYFVAQHPTTGEFHKVLAQNCASKEDSTHILLLIEDHKSPAWQLVEWVPVATSRPTL